MILKADNLGIKNFDIVKRLKKILKYDNITLINDGKAAALCEKAYGSLKQYQDAIFICLGTGIRTVQFLWEENC